MKNNTSNRIFIFFISIVFFFSSFSRLAYARASEKESTTIVLIDISGSMKASDPNQDTLQFAQLLVDLHQNEKHKIGFIAFHENIELLIEPVLITDFNIESIKKELETLNYHKNTDLGLGLKTAADILKDASGQMILLSDGETELIKANQMRSNSDNQSDQLSALDFCVSNQIPIHSFILQTVNQMDMNNTSSLAEKTGGVSRVLDPSAALLPQYLSAYAGSQNLSFSKLSSLKSDGQKQTIEVDLPFIEYIQNLDYVLLSSSPLDSCEYNDASSARISLGNTYSSIHKASDTLSTQKIALKAPENTQIDAYSLKKIHFIPLLSYSETDQAFQVRIIAPDTKETIVGNTPLPVKVSIYKGKELQDTLSLDYENQIYTRSYSPHSKEELDAIAAVSIDQEEIKSEKITLPTLLPGPKAIPAERLIFKKSDKIVIEPSDYFDYSGSEKLTYKLLESDIPGVFSQADGKIALSQASIIKDGFILLEASDPYGQTAENKIPVSIHISQGIIIASVIAAALAIAALLLFLLGWLRKKRHYFNGVLTGNFIATHHGKDLPEFFCMQDILSKETKITLKDIFDLAGVTESLPEAVNIHFKAQANNEILFRHTSNCKILVESETVHRNQKFSLRYGNRIFIFFEDDSTELEIQYLQANTVKGDGNRRVSIKMSRN